MSLDSTSWNSLQITILEEFEAILGSLLDSNRQITIPPLEIPDLHSMQYQMARIFNFSSQISLYHISGTEIMMSSLLDSVVVVDKMKVYWPRMLAFYLHSQFLLVSLFGDCDPKILHILD